MGDLWSVPNPEMDALLMEKLKMIGLYAGIALTVWYLMKRERV